MHSLYYEDLEIPMRLMSTGRTITESDATMFCMVSGDWNPLHCDDEFAKTTMFGKRVVAGVFGFAVLAGMFTRWGIFEESGLAMLSIEDWVFKEPIFIGDTIKVEMIIESKRLTSKGDKGVIQRAFSLINQHGRVVQAGKSPMLIARSPGARA